MKTVIKYNKKTKMVDVFSSCFHSYTMGYWRMLQQRRRRGLQYLREAGIVMKKRIT